MSTTQRHGLRRLVRNRRRGQSIPIIALMIVILVAMVGLSVDVGNTFSEEREAVSASNAAAIAGMTAYIQRSAGTTDQSIYESIANSLRSNGIIPGDGTNGTRNVTAYYLNSQGELLADHPIVGSGGTAPNGVGFIQVKVDGKVDTSFARVVGRNDLPINASAHAGLCPVNSGVYPLAVDTATITGNMFNDTGIAEDDKDTDYIPVGSTYQRRIYVKEQGTSGNFSYLRWMEGEGAYGKNSTSAYELAGSLSGEGNIAAGFEEAPWPAGEAAPAGYPIDPGTLNAGDWVWGTPGWKENNGAGPDGASVSGALDNHIYNGTRMILPIYSEIRGTGSNVQMRIVRLGVFILTGKGKEPSRGPYFDMIFLGDPVRQYTACTVTPPPPAGNELELFGNVSFFPEYQIDAREQKPIQYVVVLDASGSMSANFNGQCNNGSGTVQCANGPAGYPAVQVTGTGTNWFWQNQSERRIYVAKQALNRLVNLSYMPGNSSYTNPPNRPSDQMAVVWFNDTVPSGNTLAFTNNPTDINNFITRLNRTSNDNYRSQGGTNGAAGLYRASLLFNAAPKTVLFNGKQVEYKRVVLFITDGVSNQFLNTGANNLSGGSSNAGTYPSGSFCNGLGTLVVESAECQTTDGASGSTWNSWDRPITQMINTSQQFLRNTSTNASVFVVALSNIPSTGLRDGVPSQSDYFFQAEGLERYSDGTTNVDVIIDRIKTEIISDCTPGPSGASTGIITSDQFVNGTNGLNYPQVGLVTIKNSTDTLTAPIKADSNGTLSYYFAKVPQGTYRMEAYLFYHHPLDPPGVMRMYSKIWTAGQALDDFTVDVSPSNQSSSFVQRIEQPLTLKLNGNVCPTL